MNIPTEANLWYLCLKYEETYYLKKIKHNAPYPVPGQQSDFPVGAQYQIGEYPNHTEG